MRAHPNFAPGRHLVASDGSTPVDSLSAASVNAPGAMFISRLGPPDDGENAPGFAFGLGRPKAEVRRGSPKGSESLEGRRRRGEDPPHGSRSAVTLPTLVGHSSVGRPGSTPLISRGATPSTRGVTPGTRGVTPQVVHGGGFPRDTYALRIEGLAGTVVEPPHRSRTPSPVQARGGRP